MVAGGRLPLPTLSPPGGGDITALAGGAAAPQHITSSASRADGRTGGQIGGRTAAARGGAPARRVPDSWRARPRLPPTSSRAQPPGASTPGSSKTGMGTGTGAAGVGGRLPAQNKGCGGAQRGRGRASLDLRRERWGHGARRSAPRQRDWGLGFACSSVLESEGLTRLTGSPPPGSVGP